MEKIDLFSNPINRANTIQKQLFLYLPVLPKRPDVKLEKRSNVPDSYPSKAQKVCLEFIKMYDGSDAVQCVAKCLGGNESAMLLEPDCDKRNKQRLESHIACYAKCSFIPTKGIPWPDGPEVGWNMLLPGWWRARGIDEALGNLDKAINNSPALP
jgi:hypothetical protein